MTDQEYKDQVKRKNRIMLVLLVLLIAVLYGLSFIRFGEAVYS